VEPALAGRPWCCGWVLRARASDVPTTMNAVSSGSSPRAAGSEVREARPRPGRVVPAPRGDHHRGQARWDSKITGHLWGTKRL
jgi:hypothetical protein